MSEGLILPSDCTFSPSDKKNVENYLISKNISLKSTLGGNKSQNILFYGVFTDVKKKKVWDLSSKPATGEEDKLLVLTSFRFLIFSSQGGKLIGDLHVLDLLEYQTANNADASLKFRQSTIIFNNSDKVPELANAIKNMYALNFPGMSGEGSNIPMGSCGGFTNTYRCISEFYGISVREDICWEIDNLFEANQIKDLNLTDWPESLTPLQGKAMIESLKYNQWFDSLSIYANTVAGSCKVSNDGVLVLNGVLQTNKKLVKLLLQNIGARESWITPETWMTIALNKYIHTIDLSYNAIEDRGCQSLCNDWLSTISREIHSLNLSKCSIGKQGLSLLFKTLRANTWIVKNIKSLSISNNRLEDAASDMVSFLSEAVQLKSFEMANTQPTWSAMKPNNTIQKSKETRQIQRLDISGNKLTSNIGKGSNIDSSNDLSAFLSLITPNLIDINLSSTYPPANSIYTILSAVINLFKLDLSDNDLGEDGIVKLVDSLCHTTLPKLKHLYINRNIYVASTPTDLLTQTLSLTKVTSLIGNKTQLLSNANTSSSTSISNAIKSLIRLISANSYALCPLETLHIAGNSSGRLRSEIIPLAQALLKNDTITEIDISGHHAGDDLAISLGRVIQVNKTIKTLVWDENLTTSVGMEHFSLGFRRNQSLQHMPLPVLDIADFLKQPENTPSMQLIKERLKLVSSSDSNPITVQERVKDLASDIQSQIINNNLRKMKDAINKAVSRKRNEAVLTSQMSSPKITSPQFNNNNNNSPSTPTPNQKEENSEDNNI